MGQQSLSIAEVLPMVSDFLTVASFVVFTLTKLLSNSCSLNCLLNDWKNAVDFRVRSIFTLFYILISR